MEINEHFIKLIQTTKELESLDFFMGKAELSTTEFRLLREVILEGRKGREIISSELARRLGITRSAISQIVTKLESKNLVKRTASDTDKKIAYIKLSDFAAETFEKQCVRGNEFIQKVVDIFGEERMHSLCSEYDELYKVFLQVKEECKNRRSAGKANN